MIAWLLHGEEPPKILGNILFKEHYLYTHPVDINTIVLVKCPCQHSSTDFPHDVTLYMYMSCWMLNSV